MGEKNEKKNMAPLFSPLNYFFGVLGGKNGFLTTGK